MAGNIEIQDPYEGYNRAVFAFNDALDVAIAEPIARTYRFVAPKPVRTGVRNFLQNLKSPVVLLNQLLQGDLKGARDVVVRFAVNTTVGVGGLFDVAAAEGIKYEPEDFGQTLAVWGVGNGPYVVLPILGPSSLRDYAGYAVDVASDPISWYLYNTDRDELLYGRLGLSLLDKREAYLDTIDDLKTTSLDYYAAVRSAYYQQRAALVEDKDPDAMSIPEIPDYEDDGEDLSY